LKEHFELQNGVNANLIVLTELSINNTRTEAKISTGRGKIGLQQNKI